MSVIAITGDFLLDFDEKVEKCLEFEGDLSSRKFIKLMWKLAAFLRQMFLVFSKAEFTPSMIAVCTKSTFWLPIQRIEELMLGDAIDAAAIRGYLKFLQIRIGVLMEEFDYT